MEFNAQNPLKIGTRGSPLALAQAYETRDRLMTVTGFSKDAFSIHVIKTTGDRIQDRPLSKIGGKGLFTKEIEEALLEHSIDIAVHSMKDMPVDQPEGLLIDCYLPREDVRDAFVSKIFSSIHDLPQGATVGTSSLRRRAQLIHCRPDLHVVEFRGNVQTRLRKLDDGVASATFLAMAGLRRLGLDELTDHPIDEDDMLPAIAQGAIGIERRTTDPLIAALVSQINHEETAQRLSAERALLSGLDGSCQTPIGGLAVLIGDTLHLQGEVLRPDGSEKLTDAATGPVVDAVRIGSDMAQRLKTQMGDGFF